MINIVFDIKMGFASATDTMFIKKKAQLVIETDNKILKESCILVYLIIPA